MKTIEYLEVSDSSIIIHYDNGLKEIRKYDEDEYYNLFIKYSKYNERLINDLKDNYITACNYKKTIAIILLLFFLLFIISNSILMLGASTLLYFFYKYIDIESDRIIDEQNNIMRKIISTVKTYNN